MIVIWNSQKNMCVNVNGKMKKVRFGKDTIIPIDNISKYLSWESSFNERLLRHLEGLSYVREMYNEKRNTPLLIYHLNMICSHEDVYHVDIYLKRETSEQFMLDLANNMELVFSCKSSSVHIGDKTLFCFLDGFSNPIFDELFSVKERWGPYVSPVST